MSITLLLVICGWLTLPASVHAQTQRPHSTSSPPASAPVSAADQATAAVRDFVLTQTRGLSGRVEVSVEPLPPNVLSSPCAAFAPALPAGSRLWGKTVVALSCLAPNNWLIYVPVRVDVFGTYLKTAKPIASGQIIAAKDLVSAEGNLTALPDGTFTRINQALGQRTRVGLVAGLPLGEQHIVVTPLIRQGQTVKVLARGSGFSATGEGVALANAAAGDSIRVRMSSGQTVTGVARAAGLVELAF